MRLESTEVDQREREREIKLGGGGEKEKQIERKGPAEIKENKGTEWSTGAGDNEK